jgi:hypothetical protein
VAFLNLCSKSILLFAGIIIAVVFPAFLPSGWGAEPTNVCKKEIPAITFKNLSPPYRDYAYFQNQYQFPVETLIEAFFKFLIVFGSN